MLQYLISLHEKNWSTIIIDKIITMMKKWYSKNFLLLFHEVFKHQIVFLKFIKNNKEKMIGKWLHLFEFQKKIALHACIAKQFEKLNLFEHCVKYLTREKKRNSYTFSWFHENKTKQIQQTLIFIFRWNLWWKSKLMYKENSQTEFSSSFYIDFKAMKYQTIWK